MKYQFDEVRFLTQEELGMTHLSFTAREYAARLTSVRQKIKDLEIAIAEHGDESGNLKARLDGMKEVLGAITGIKQTF